MEPRLGRANRTVARAVRRRAFSLGVGDGLVDEVGGHFLVVVVLGAERSPAMRERSQVDRVADDLRCGDHRFDDLESVA